MRRKFAVVNGATAETTEAMLARTVMNNTYELCGMKFASVPTMLMELDMSYQRLVSNTAAKIASEFDVTRVQVLTVSYRDGKFYVIDGQHRLTAARVVGVTELPCIIHTGLTRADEALMFARQNVNVKKLYPFDTYKANLACGNADIPEIKVDMDIARICAMYGVDVKKVGAKQTNPKVIRSLTHTRHIVRIHGVDMLDLILSNITASNWNTCADAYARDIMLMLKGFFVDNANDLHTAEKKARTAMNSISPTDLLAMAKYKYPEYKLNTALNLCFRDVVAETNTKKH